MVGCSSRRQVFKEDEEEFESIAYINNKKKAKMSQNAEEENVLAGIDVEGCSEQEKENIRRAVLESKNKVYIQPYHEDEQKPRPSSTSRDIDEQSSRDIFGGSDDNDDDVPVPAANDSDDDDDETQPPESVDMGTFNLVEPTLVDLDDNTEDMIIDDKHSTYCDDSPTSFNSAEMEKLDSTQSFNPAQDIEMDKKNNTNSRPSTSASNSSQVPGPSSKLSQDTKQSQNSNKTTGSSSQDEVELDDVHVPLQRHYRVVSTQTSSTDDFFSKDGVVTESSVKAICQLFDIFRMKLKKAQEKCREKISWGEPVKPGSHQSKTVDVKRRGHDSIYIGLSSDEDYDSKNITETRQSRRPGLRSRKTPSYCAIKTPSDSDNDLPDLIIEDVGTEKRSELLRERASRKKGQFSLPAKERNLKKSESSSDFNLDSDNNAFDTLGKKTVGESNNDDGKLNSNDIHKRNKSSLRNKTKTLKNMVVMETKDGNISKRILVEETQDQDLNLKEITKEMKEESVITVAETQVDDDDFDWLQAEKSHSVENSHNSKVRDYASKKEAQSKVNKKRVTASDKIVDLINDVNIAGNIVNLDKNSSDVAKEDLEGNSDKNTKNDKKRFRVKKRKADVDEDQVLVEETQGDSDVENVQSKRGRKGVKRKWFHLDRGSSPQIVSVADSQDEAESMEQKRGEDKVNLNDIENETRNNDLNDDVNETCNNDQEDSQSPIIKRSKKSTLKGEGIAGMNKKNLFSKTGKDSEETLNERKQRSVRANRSNIKRDLLQNDTVFKTGRSEMRNLPKGAEKFLSRQISVESIESKSSDDISMTSSQRSGMIIDEQGELYSTQFCEIKDRKRKATPSSTYKSSLLSEKMDVFDEVMRLEEPASVDLSKENNKDNFKSNRKVKAASTGKRKLFKKTKLDEFVISKGSSTDLPIKLDSDSDDEVTNMIENNKDKVKKSRRMPRDKTKMNKHIDKDIDLDLVVDPSDLNHKREATETRRNEGTSNPRSVKKSRIKTEDQIKIPDYDVYDIDDVESDGGNNAEDIIAEAGERRRINDEAYLQRFENISKGNSFNNASTHAQLMTSGETSHRKRRQYEDFDNDETAQNKVETTECPLCNQLFPNNIIQDHAADCNGPIKQEDDQSKSPPLNIRHENTPEVEQTDSVKHNLMVLKQLSNTDQQESEGKICWICECVIKEQYEVHIDRCYKEAEKQQRAMEACGYKESVEVEIEQPSPARATRSRFRQHETGDNPFAVTTYAKPRRAVNNVNVGPDKDEREVTHIRQGRNITRRKGERTGSGKSATATEGYKSDINDDSGDDESSDGGNSWDSEESTDSSEDDNISIATVLRSGSNALISRPWNNPPAESKNKTNDHNEIPDWIKARLNSPIKSFVPISQQEDNEYFQKQFSYSQKNVEKRALKRKRGTGRKKRRKRRRTKH
ncbi:hypothetical protein ACF0H5_009302 [Mactra antiquata]